MIPDGVDHDDVLAGRQNNISVVQAKQEVRTTLWLDKRAVRFIKHNVELTRPEAFLSVMQSAKPVALLAYGHNEEFVFCYIISNSESHESEGIRAVYEVVEQASMIEVVCMLQANACLGKHLHISLEVDVLTFILE